MAATNSLIDINQAVSRFLLKYKLSTEDAFIFTEHACDCIRDFSLFDSGDVVSEKVTISALGIIEMPDSMVGFNGLFIPINGELWPFTEVDTIVNTTTTTAGVEGQDSDFGEGVAIYDYASEGYGGRPGVNDYKYTLDWQARRIFCEGITSDTVLLRYVTSGVEITGTTYVPEFVLPMIDTYLLWKSSYWRPDLKRERPLLERDYTNAELKVRNFINSMSYDQWRDVLLSTSVLAPIR